jgi:hypothetical protein
MPKLTDFFVREEEFNKLKKAFETKDPSSRTQSDVDTYNKAVKDMNSSINAFN